jgi:hypothetical protein
MCRWDIIQHGLLVCRVGEQIGKGGGTVILVVVSLIGRFDVVDGDIGVVLSRIQCQMLTCLNHIVEADNAFSRGTMGPGSWVLLLRTCAKYDQLSVVR